VRLGAPDAWDVQSLKETEGEIRRSGAPAAGRQRGALEERRSGAPAERLAATIAGRPVRVRGLIRVPAPAGRWSARPAVLAQGSDRDFVALRVPKSDGVCDLLHCSIRRNVLYRACAEEELRDLVAASAEARFLAGAMIIRQGDGGGDLG